MGISDRGEISLTCMKWKSWGWLTLSSFGFLRTGSGARGGRRAKMMLLMTVVFVSLT